MPGLQEVPRYVAKLDWVIFDDENSPVDPPPFRVCGLEVGENIEQEIGRWTKREGSRKKRRRG